MVPWLLWVAVTLPGPARAATPSSVAAPIQASVLTGADSIRLKLLAYLARGDIAGALAMYEAETGHEAPEWLRDLQVAYSVVNQTAGNCQQVARAIHTAFIKLGQSPQFIAFRANQAEDYMVFELESGRDASVSHTGYHVAVRIGDVIYDAYTGPLGMRLSDYVSRLHALQGFTWMVVSKP